MALTEFLRTRPNLPLHWLSCTDGTPKTTECRNPPACRRTPHYRSASRCHHRQHRRRIAIASLWIERRSLVKRKNIDLDLAAVIAKSEVQVSYVRLNAEKLTIVRHGYAVHLAEISRRALKISRYAMIAVVVQLTEDKFTHMGQCVRCFHTQIIKKSTTLSDSAHKSMQKSRLHNHD